MPGMVPAWCASHTHLALGSPPKGEDVGAEGPYTQGVGTSLNQVSLTLCLRRPAARPVLHI